MALDQIGFGVQAAPESDGTSWLALARRADATGFDALCVPDHLGVTASPIPSLAAAASVTSKLKLTTYVLNAGVREPAHIAAEVSTLYRLSRGRAVLGLGAGHTPAEWTMTGRARPSPLGRVSRLVEVTQAVRDVLDGDDIPLLVGGNNRALLGWAGRAASIVSLSGLGRTLEDGHRHEVRWSAAEIDERVSIVRDAARRAGHSITLDALVQLMDITSDRLGAAERWTRRLCGVSVPDLLTCPYALVGTVAQIVDQLRSNHERWGFTSYVVRTDAMDAIAPVIERLRST